ncbi:MAG: PP2C family protein-serine/threonine phosphatase [Planctomycetota bacterium]
MTLQGVDTFPKPTARDASTTVRPDERLHLVVDLVREMSLQTDPQDMVMFFRRRVHAFHGASGSVSLSRRGLNHPQYRITRSTKWKEFINPWTDTHRLPLLQGGLLGELLYSDLPRIMSDVRVPESDPAYEHLHDARCLVALPLFENGVALNMVIRTATRPGAWDESDLPNSMLEANLFGRATNHLLLAQQLKRAYGELDHEMKRVAEIQRSLLPARLPRIPTLDIAVSYATATRAGGDYYDFFDLGDGRWGLLIADAGGHGTAAAVIMAMLRTLLHANCLSCSTPGGLLKTINTQLCDRSDRYSAILVTAFFGIYNPQDGSLTYSCAGHNPPLLVDPGAEVTELEDAQSLPLAVDSKAEFPEATVHLRYGHTLLMYTDGITEALNRSGEMYGRQRLLSCVREDVPNAQHIIDCVTNKLLGFMDGQPQLDDQTLVALLVKRE